MTTSRHGRKAVIHRHNDKGGKMEKVLRRFKEKGYITLKGHKAAAFQRYMIRKGYEIYWQLNSDNSITFTY